MAEAKTVSKTEFLRNVERYMDRASGGDIVRVTQNGAPVGGFLSARALEDYERLRRRERETLITDALPEDALADIEAAEYDAVPR
jgi:hypothetical protein